MRILLKLFVFLRRYRWRMAGAFLCLMLSSGFSLVVPQIVGRAIDTGVSGGQGSFLILAALAVIAASALRGTFTYFQSYLGEAISAHAAYDIRNAMYDRIQHLGFDFHDKSETGQLMSRATADIEAVRWFLSFGVLRVAQLAVMLLAIATMLVIMNWSLALISLACLPLAALRAVTVSRKMRAVWMRVQQSIGDMGTVLHEALSGIRVVKAFHREDYEASRFAARAGEVYDGSVEANRLYAFNTPLVVFILAVATGLILLWGGRQVVAGRLTQGELTQFLLYALMLAMPVRMLGYLSGVASRAISAGERIFEVLETQPTIREAPHPVQLGRARGHIRFENVSFRYDSTGSVLEDVTFEAKPGQLVAVVGATGSGKTTVINLIPRFYDVTCGRITIDGIDIRDLSLSSLRRNVGVVQQDVFLFSASVHDNIAYGAPDASRDRVAAAARAAHLHDFVASLPKGYDTWVGERGITLSGGQRQRLAIARTLLTDPPILILDDATSSVDTETEYQIQRALTTVMLGRTSLVIAHRLSTVKRADLILVIEDGHIVERGRHDELLDSDGFYRRVYDMQLRDQEAEQTARYQEGRV
ncbi:MAG: ABC transporter ATP-binding protein [Chloroflexi bacterium]|nr:ABC transporter ATP-binding protein [Chloroflexota bacterium]